MRSNDVRCVFVLTDGCSLAGVNALTGDRRTGVVHLVDLAVRMTVSWCGDACSLRVPYALGMSCRAGLGAPEQVWKRERQGAAEGGAGDQQEPLVAWQRHLCAREEGAL